MTTDPDPPRPACEPTDAVLAIGGIIASVLFVMCIAHALWRIM